MRVQVAIVGAGPAGLTLGRLLHLAGVSNLVIERRDREYVESRVRAGLLEHGTVEVLGALGVDTRLREEGFEHHGFELRFGDRRHRVEFAGATGGRSVWMYPQQKVVQDLLQARDAARDPTVFGAENVRFRGLDSDTPQVCYTLDGQEHRVQCDAIAGCDGFHGVSRDAIPEAHRKTYAHDYPFGWLGILADAPPNSAELVYAHHPQGFALQSLRSSTVSRIYIQVDADDDIARWPDDRIWAEIRTRFAQGGADPPVEGPILEKGITAMRSFVTEPMQRGALYLAGDAAHIVPPTAAKGLNLAVADVVALSDALVTWLVDGDRSLADAYSTTALRRVWRTQEFSRTMTSLLHHEPGHELDARLQRAQLESLVDSAHTQAAFVETYVGLPFTGQLRIGAGQSS